MRDGGESLHRYAQTHPTAYHSLGRLFGFESSDLKTSIDRMAHELPMVELAQPLEWRV